jgi:hypothetical protein
LCLRSSSSGSEMDAFATVNGHNLGTTGKIRMLRAVGRKQSCLEKMLALIVMLQSGAEDFD